MIDIPKLRIRHLLDLPIARAVLARWFVDAWPSYYGPRGTGDAVADLAAAVHPDRLPLCLVATVGADEVAGTIALRKESLASHAHLTPWLAALLVAPDRRRRGIGSRLVAAAEAEARRLGFERLYAGTEAATGILLARNWRFLERGTAIVDVFQLDL